MIGEAPDSFDILLKSATKSPLFFLGQTTHLLERYFMVYWCKLVAICPRENQGKVTTAIDIEPRFSIALRSYQIKGGFVLDALVYHKC